MSDRNGSMEIWTSNRDGSNPIQLTTVRLAGTPRWSPDSKTIAFDVGWREHGAIFIVRSRWRSSTANCAGWQQQCRSQLVAGRPLDLLCVGPFGIDASMEDASRWRATGSSHDARRICAHGVAGWQDSLLCEKRDAESRNLADTHRRRARDAREPDLRPGTWASWAEVGHGIFFIQQGPAELPC